MADARLFGTSGIRGVIGRDLTLALCHDVGRALGSTLTTADTVCVATDTRLSREKVRDAFTSGLVSTGLEVVDLGVLPTPALALCTRAMGFATGAMITASHNPPEYNGIKLFGPDAVGYSREQEASIEEVYRRRRFRRGSGKATSRKATPADYLSYTAADLPVAKVSKGLKVVVDSGNGAASGFAAEMLRQLGVETLSLHDSPDGRFPGRSPEPKPETLGGTIAFVREKGADLAFCFDGDADRVVFCDGEGFLGFNEMNAFLSSVAVRDSGKTKVAATVESGRHIDLALEELGAEVVRGKVGDVNLAHLTRQIEAAAGVESVGVYLFPELGYYPDSMAATVRLLAHVGNAAEIREYLRALPQLYFKKAAVDCPDDRKVAATDELTSLCTFARQRQRLHDNLILDGLANGEARINRLDGLRIEFGDSWVLIRPSGTEPIVRVIAESESAPGAQRLVDEGTQLVAECLEEQ